MNAIYSFQKLAEAYNYFPEMLGEEYEKKLEEHVYWFLELRQEVLTARSRGPKPNYAEPGISEEQMVKEDYLFTSAMASAYTVLQPYNAGLAAQALSQSQKAYQNAFRFKFTGDLQYMAAASLFRASGNYACHGIVKEHYSEQKTMTAERGYKMLSESGADFCKPSLWGDLFYMTSTKGSDLNLCDTQMSGLMDMCGEFLNISSRKSFGLIDEKEQALEDAVWLTMADYIIVSREYRNVSKGQLHAALHEIDEIHFSHEQKSTLIFILSNLAESESEEEE